MFSLSFAAARPSLSSVYHNLPAGARGKPPSAHSTARPGNHVLIRAARPGKHRLIRPAPHRSRGRPLPVPRIFAAPRGTPLFVRFSRAAHDIAVSGRSRPPCKHIFPPPRGTTLSVRFSRAARGAAFPFLALRRPPRRKPRGFRVCHVGFCTCRGGVRRGGFRVCRDAPKKQSGARKIGLRAVVTGFTGASGKARRSPRRSCRAGYPGGRHRRTRSRRGTARLPL